MPCQVKKRKKKTNRIKLEKNKHEGEEKAGGGIARREEKK